MGGHCRLVVGDKNALVLRRNGQHGCIVDTSQTGSGRDSEIDLRDSPNDGRTNDLIEIGVGLETDRHSARVRSLPLGIGHAGHRGARFGANQLARVSSRE